MSVDAQPVQDAAAARATRRERTAWFVLAILLLFSIAAPLNQFKVPPIMPILMDAFKLSVGRAGLFMSVYAVTGLVLALPAGLIFQKLGYRITGLIAGGSIAIGAILGATSSGMGGMLMSRVIEGIGARDHRRMVRRSKAWSCDGHLVCLGPHRLDLDVDPRASPEPGNELASGLVVRLSVRARGDGSLPGFRQASSKRFCGERPLIRTTSSCERGTSFAQSRCLADQSGVWLLQHGDHGLGTFAPTYLNLVRGMSLPQAALLSSVVSMVSIVSCPAGGVLSDRVGSRKRPYLVGLTLMAIVMPLIAVMGSGALIVLVIVQGLVGGLVPTNIFSTGVEVAGDERLGGLAMGVIMVGQNAGMLVGPIVFGVLIESAGSWPLAFGSLAVMCLFGVPAGWLAKAK